MPNLVLLAQVVWAQRCQKAMGIQGFKKILAFFKYLKIFFCTFRLASVLKPWGYVYIHTEVRFPLLASAFLVFFEKYQRFKKRNKICNQFLGFFSRFGQNRAQTLMPFFFPGEYGWLASIWKISGTWLKKFYFLPKKWNIALFWKTGLDFEMQYLRFYWTDFAKIWYASKQNM